MLPTYCSGSFTLVAVVASCRSRDDKLNCLAKKKGELAKAETTWGTTLDSFVTRHEEGATATPQRGATASSLFNASLSQQLTTTATSVNDPEQYVGSTTKP